MRCALESGVHVAAITANCRRENIITRIPAMAARADATAYHEWQLCCTDSPRPGGRLLAGCCLWWGQARPPTALDPRLPESDNATRSTCSCRGSFRGTASRIVRPRRVEFVPAAKVADENRDMLDDKPVTQKKSASLGGFLGGFGAAVAVAAAVFIVWQRVSPVSTSISGAHPTSSFAAQVADETAQFGVKPHTVVLTTDKAMQVPPDRRSRGRTLS
jgi:hypothetical protein